MKKLIKLLALSLFFSINSTLAQNNPNADTGPVAKVARPIPTAKDNAYKVNYVRVFDMLIPVSDPSSISSLIKGEVMINTQYMDGLGRPIQMVSWQSASDNTDLIQAIEYDQFGRVSHQYLPFASSEGDGSFKLNSFHQQADFYGDPITGYQKDEDIFYGVIQYDNSPLNRMVKNLPAGNSWAGSDVGVSMDYETNSLLDDVRVWSLNNSGIPESNVVYTEELLRKTVTTDENGAKTIVFQDKFGRTLLKRVEVNTDVSEAQVYERYANTYYVYDVKDRLRFILPPRAVELLKAHNWVWSSANVDNNLNDLVFEKVYDGRDRLIIKRTPGAGVEEMIYDKMDRVVLSQDANQREYNQWTFVKYDQFGRVVFTGFYDEPDTNMDSREELQQAADDWDGAMFVIPENQVPNSIVGVDITVSVHDPDTEVYIAGNEIDFLPGFDNGTSEFEAIIIPGTGGILDEYQDNTFPYLGTNPADKLRTINYYDDYRFTSRTFYNGQSNLEQAMIIPAASASVKGLPTGSKVRILGGTDWLTTAMWYDDKKRIIQTQADNHLGGEDITTTEFDFTGRIVKTFAKHTNPQAAAPDNETLTLKTFTYDGQNRLSSSHMRINDEAVDKTIISNTYTQLGKLDVTTLGTGIETLDRDYNIRGWLKGINRDKLGTGISIGSNYFAMELSYDFGFSNSQLNGNIAGMSWKTKSSVATRYYGFDYDPSNRLTSADYSQLGSAGGNTPDFSVSNLTYDVNGNLKSLTRNGVIAGTNVVLDELSYTYMNSGNSNQLLSISDTKGNLNQGDFKDLNTGNDDYTYDANGNMTQDKNKGIDGANDIKYNHLNLPVEVKFEGDNQKKIRYTYDAMGIKLKKEVVDGATTRITDYIGGFIYENNELQHFMHEAGRVRKHDGGLHYDYFIKDHLGNTRLTLTEEQEVVEYLATMESEFSGFEESLFLNIASTRGADEMGVNTTNETGITNNEYARLVGNDPTKRIGPAKLLMVLPGDQIDVEVEALYKSHNSSSSHIGTGLVIDAVASVFGGVSGGSVEQNAIYDLFDNVDISTYLNDRVTVSHAPKAYLNYIRFDQDFNFIDGGADQITALADLHQTLTISTSFTGANLNGGYVYIWVSNEGGNDLPVYFDDLKITHTKGAILQEDHYYPFGANIASLSSTAPLSKPNQFKFNGIEMQQDLGWDSYLAYFRSYDPIIGRWSQVDPKTSERESPYVGMANNPIFYTDPLGDIVQGVDKSSGMWLKNTIHGSFSGENAAEMRKLFKLESDGITMAEITLEEFIAAAVNLTPDQLQLAFSYFIMINDKFNVHTVEFAREKDNLVKKFNGYERGIDVGSAGENKRTIGGGSHSVIIYDFSYFYGNQGYAPLGGLGYLPKNIEISLGQILAHELLGHGNGIGGRNFDAVNMENLYLRAQGLNYYRTGEGHGSKSLGPMSGGRLTEAQATKNVPVWARIPSSLKNKIHKPNTFGFNSSLLRVIHPMDGVDIHKRTGN